MIVKNVLVLVHFCTVKMTNSLFLPIEGVRQTIFSVIHMQKKRDKTHNKDESFKMNFDGMHKKTLIIVL